MHYSDTPLYKHNEICHILLMKRNGWWKPTHPLVEKVLCNLFAPADWHLLALEMPSVPEDGDKTRVSYWQSDAKQAKNLRTVTSLGKYLRRHFLTLTDHAIRDAVALAAPAKYEIWTGTDRMVQAVQEGPKSCMQWEDDFDVHPYEVYTPEFGWAVAVRLQGSTIMGRCVIHTEKKVFVRSYGRDEHDGRSQDDFGLETWLRDQGYRERSDWPEGVKFARIEWGHDCLMPYLDASSSEGRRVDICDTFIVRDDQGDYVCDNTNGEMTHEPGASCEECGDRTDDLTYLDFVERSVCSCCLESGYTYVRGTRGSRFGTTVTRYYVSSDNAVSVDGENYDEEHLPEYIVQLHDGDYAHQDNTVFVESEGEHYLDTDVSNREVSSKPVVRLEDGTYELRDDAAYCQCNAEWYPQGDCREFKDGEYCLLDDVDSYLEGLTEDELRAKVDDEEAERIMESDGWAYKVNQEQETQLPLPLPDVECSVSVKAQSAEIANMLQTCTDKDSNQYKNLERILKSWSMVVAGLSDEELEYAAKVSQREYWETTLKAYRAYFFAATL